MLAFFSSAGIALYEKTCGCLYHMFWFTVWWRSCWKMFSVAFTLSPLTGRQLPFNEEIFVILTVLERQEWLCPRHSTVELYCEAVDSPTFPLSPQRPHKEVSCDWPSQTARQHEGELVWFPASCNHVAPYALLWVGSLMTSTSLWSSWSIIILNK